MGPRAFALAVWWRLLLELARELGGYFRDAREKGKKPTATKLLSQAAARRIVERAPSVPGLGLTSAQAAEAIAEGIADVLDLSASRRRELLDAVHVRVVELAVEAGADAALDAAARAVKSIDSLGPDVAFSGHRKLGKL